ncbi:uncharacterized protein A4U43_C07F23710 [Asparagus officinalis]|uniref:Ubiquitin-like domain-containing protein n=1 Tax=Asparagus officinalis TaxID=4686 RepID=A0A5P1EEP8_ASPOF|nr:uncharacterized protein A4U43_C07F23710 [Asparagus officinalis]
MGGDGDGDSSTATVNIRYSNGSKIAVETPLDATVETFKALLAEKCDVPAAQQRLIYKGRILKDDQTLASYGVENDHTIHLVRGAAAQPTLANTNAGAGNLGASGAGLGGEGLGSSLFPGLGLNGLGSTGGSGLFGLPELDQMQQQLSQNPNMMRELMNLPAIQNMMNNPDIMRNLIMNNPQMREIIDRNPELAHVLNDPSTLRQTLEAARNPEIMREMMRNTDRAMSNIESTPEGFNMLRRMYETVQEPFLNATTMAGETGNGAGSNPFAALLGNQGTTQTTDRSTNSTTAGSEATAGSPAPNTNPLPNPWGNTGGTQPNNARSVSEARAPGIAGLGGLGIPNLESLAGSMPDPSTLSQVMQNPAINQMMQSLISNPQYMNQVLSLNPQLQTAMDSNPQLREMLQNPDFIRQMTNPETMQHLMSLQSLFSEEVQYL